MWEASASCSTGGCPHTATPHTQLQVACPNQGQASHLYFVGPSPNPGPGTGSPSGGGGVASGCIYCGSVCRIVVKKGIFLSTQSDDTKGPCCDGCK